MAENFDPVAHNRAAWDREVDNDNEWTRPVDAESAGQLAGFAEARGGRFRRNRGTAHVVIGVLAAARGGRRAAPARQPR